MDDCQHEKYQAYIRGLADQLSLQDWEVVLKRDWADEDANASSGVSRTKNRIWIEIAEDFGDFSLEQQRRSLVHELLHAHVARTEKTIYRLEEMLPTNKAALLTRKAFDDEMEIVVERLARILAPFMPLPPR
jgi:hypothetical protein